MFIITMVFLTGLVVFVSQMLLSYSVVDVSDVPDRTGGFVVKEYVSIINDTIQSSRNATDADNNIKELHSFLERLVTEGYHSNIMYNGSQGYSLVPEIDTEKFNSLSGDPLLNVDMDIMTGSTEVKGLYDFYRLFIIFPAEPRCKVETGDVYLRELWCKSEDLEEGTCKDVWTDERAEDCETCHDGGNEATVKEKIELVDPCSEGDATCPPVQNIWDDCDTIQTDWAHDKTCDGNRQGTDIVHDCNVFDENNCWTFCNTVTGDIEERCDDWTCIDGGCGDSGIDWLKGLVDDCEDTCTDSDGGQNEFSRGTVNDYELCMAGDTSCPYTPYTDYCADWDNVWEYYCSGGGWAKTKMNCGRGYDCIIGSISYGKCRDCDRDNDGYCPSDGDCDDSHCPMAHPGAGYQIIPGGEQSGTFTSCSLDEGGWDYNCNGRKEYQRRQVANIGSSCTSDARCWTGWKGSRAECGQEKDWWTEVACCTWTSHQSGECPDVNKCYGVTTIKRIQGCK